MKILVFVLLTSILLLPVTARPCYDDITGCLNCDDQGSKYDSSCNMCDRGYRLYFEDGTGDCSICQAGKGKARDTAPQTLPTTCDVTCDPMCRFCGATPTECLYCHPGYRLDSATSTCVFCKGGSGSPIIDQEDIVIDADSSCWIVCPTGCENCISETKCVACKAGYRFDETTKKCTICENGKGRGVDTITQTASTTCDVTCAEGCKICGATPHTCVICLAGYQFSSSTKQCAKCPSGTTAPANDPETGLSTQCAACDLKCTECLGSSTNCLKCAAGHFFTVGKNTCTLCGAGTGRAADSTAPTASTTCDVTCTAPCEFCGASSTTCLGCKVHSEFNKGGSYCTTCASGKTRAADTTILLKDTYCDIPCIPGCRLCRGSANVCTGCQAGYFFNAANSACTKCSVGTGRSADFTPRSSDSVCDIVCNAGCQFCGGSNTQCYGCKEDYYLDWNTKTCQQCNTPGFTRLADTSPQLDGTTCDVKCPYGCAFCDGPLNNCFGCAAGYSYLTEGSIKSCSSCPANKGRAADVSRISSDTSCNIICDPSCLFCGASPTECVGCKKGYRLNYLLKKCELCSGGTGKAADTRAQIADTQCNIECILGCETCEDTPSSCIRCDQGFWKNDSGKCQLCPRTKGKPRDTAVVPNGSYDGNLECSITCHESCVNCKGPLATDCLGCRAGFYSNGIGKCEACGGGLTSGDRQSYTKLPPQDGECKNSCNSSCESCSGYGPSDCTRCKAGYYWIGSGKCSPCPPNSGKPADTIIKKPSDPMTENCQPCHPSCLHCSGYTKNDCMTCPAGSSHNSYERPCYPCSFGRGKPADPDILSWVNSCNLNCHSLCARCSGTTNADCIACKHGNYKQISVGCQPCPTGYGVYNDSEGNTPYGSVSDCNIVCHPSCASCWGPEAHQCTICNAGYYWSDTRACLECETGKGSNVGTIYDPYRNTELSTYCSIPCHTSCKICKGTGTNQCLLCKAGYYMKSTGDCQLCAIGTGKTADTELTIGADACDITCQPGCGVCTNSDGTGCLACNKGYYMISEGVCEPCGSGLGKLADSGLTSPTTSDAACKISCDSACATCSGLTADECVLCNKGYFRSGTTTCSVCPFGKGKRADASTVPISKDNGASECTVTCYSTCSTCFDDTSSGCLICKNSHYFSTPGTCNMCPDTKGIKPPSKPLTNPQSSSDCFLCDPNCLSCGLTNTACTRCGPGRFLKPDNTCGNCPHGWGKPADSELTIPSSDNGVSECKTPCHSSCSICSGTGSGNCVNCAEGYFWTGSSGNCQQCATKKTKARDSAIKLGSSTPDTCVSCANQCKECSGTFDNCLYCEAGYYFSAPSTCTICGTGRGKPADTGVILASTEAQSCISCHQSCDRCSGPANNNCLHCAAGHYLSASGVCTLCSLGYGNTVAPIGFNWATPVSDNGAVACNIWCHDNCSSCSVFINPSKCVGCAAGHYFKTDGTCAPCNPGYGKAADTLAPIAVATSSDVCKVKCHFSCSLCKGPNANDCLWCSAGYYVSSLYTCTFCPSGWGKTDDESFKVRSYNGGFDLCLIPCHPTCATCFGPGSNQCLGCAKGFYWTGNGMCTKCPDGTGKIADSEPKTNPQLEDVCNVNCLDSCLTCYDRTSGECVMCSDGYFRSGYNNCQMCPLNRGKLKESTYEPKVTSNNGDPECNIQCHPTCRTCRGTKATDCLNCVAGFYFSKIGTCTGCEPNTGKGDDTVTYKSALGPEACKDRCDISCNKCKGPNPSDCLNCNDGYFFENGICKLCSAGTGSAKALPSVFVYPKSSVTGGTAECTEKCVYPCISCKDSTTKGCLSCDAGHFLSAAGTCTVCRTGTGKPADPAGITTIGISSACSKTCTPGCDTCSLDRPDACLSCKAGYFRSDENSCTICSPGTGGPGSPLKGTKVVEVVGCVTCHSTCLTCSGSAADQCLSCKAGLYLSPQGICEMCPFGYGKLADLEEPIKSTSGGRTECRIPCHNNCRTCTAESDNSCIACRPGHFWLASGACTSCPALKGKPADTVILTVAQTEAACTATCHHSCQTCNGPTENDCASCAAGHWWTGVGKGAVAKCEPCPKSRGKGPDTNLFPETASSPAECRSFCDLCEGGCLTCSEKPSECALCIDTKYLTPERTCADCPENCLKCTEATKCTICEADYELTPDGKSCLKCQVMNCATCTSDPFKCTKCADKFTLKSDNECVYVPQEPPLALNLSSISVATTPQLAMNILENTLELPFVARESPNFVSITMEDIVDKKVYSCAELGCTYSIKNERLKFEFDTGITIKKGKLKIERASNSKQTSIIEASSHKNTRLLQELSNYPIVVEGVSLMRDSRLSTAAFATRIIVGVLRLPLSLLVFWKLPHFAMLMDHMVTHLKVYSVMSQPHLAYAEVVFQSVSDSRILPFNFHNPFGYWNSNTLICQGFVGLRSKNKYCTFFDNYGENIIGIASVVITCLILILLSNQMLKKSSLCSEPKNIWGIIRKGYGLPFVLSKLDANHLEIALMTLIAFSTADHSSKSVVGIITGTAALIAFGLMAKHVTGAVRRTFESSSSSADKSDPNTKVSGESALIESDSVSDIAFDKEIASFVLNESTPPTHRWSVYFFTMRYIRALLLTIFVTTVRDPVDQVVLVVILETVYLVALLLLDFRGSKYGRIFQITMHTVILLHLICRAVATSKGFSEDALQSSLATAIVVLLMVYAFAHVVACLMVLLSIFSKESTKPSTSPDVPKSTKLELMEDPEPQVGDQARNDNQLRVQPYNLRLQVSEMDLQVPSEIQENQNLPSGEKPTKISKQDEHQRARLYLGLPVPPEINEHGHSPAVENGDGKSRQQIPSLVPTEMDAEVKRLPFQQGKEPSADKRSKSSRESFADLEIPQE